MSQREEYRERMEAKAQALGKAELRALILGRWSPDYLRRALEADEHLNSISLASWDALAGVSSISKGGPCPTCGHERPGPRVVGNGPFMVVEGIWSRARSGRAWWSISDRTGVLKHVAREIALEVEP